MSQLFTNRFNIASISLWSLYLLVPLIRDFVKNTNSLNCWSLLVNNLTFRTFLLIKISNKWLISIKYVLHKAHSGILNRRNQRLGVAWMLTDQLVVLNARGPAKMRRIRQWFAMMNIENLSGHYETYSVNWNRPLFSQSKLLSWRIKKEYTCVRTHKWFCEKKTSI